MTNEEATIWFLATCHKLVGSDDDIRIFSYIVYEGPNHDYSVDWKVPKGSYYIRLDGEYEGYDDLFEADSWEELFKKAGLL
jgi:hypothetical protein